MESLGDTLRRQYGPIEKLSTATVPVGNGEGRCGSKDRNGFSSRANSSRHAVVRPDGAKHAPRLSLSFPGWEGVAIVASRMSEISNDRDGLQAHFGRNDSMGAGGSSGRTHPAAGSSKVGPFLESRRGNIPPGHCESASSSSAARRATASIAASRSRTASRRPSSSAAIASPASPTMRRQRAAGVSLPIVRRPQRRVRRAEWSEFLFSGNGLSAIDCPGLGVFRLLQSRGGEFPLRCLPEGTGFASTRETT